MMKRVRNFVAAMVFMVVSSMSMAGLYYDWTNEETVDAGTVGLWHFNEGTGNSALNSVSGGLPLYRQGTTGWAVGGGKFGTGGSFPGGIASTDYFQISYDGGNGRNLDALEPDSSLSVAIWVQPDALPTAASPRQVIVDKAGSHTPSAGYQMYFWYDTASENIYLKTVVGTATGANIQQNSVIDLVSGEWTHLAMVWDAADDTLKVYQDGTLLGSKLSAGSVYAPSITGSSNPQILRVGNRLVGAYGVLDGVLDDLKISDVAIEYAAVPEPATVAILALGCLFIRKK